MHDSTYLVFQDGSVHEGVSFGAEADGLGEVVFNTSMTGYQEVLTDPSYAGQLVTLTYPLVGNYGINPEDFESDRIQVGGLIVRENCELPSHGRSDLTLHEFLAGQGIPGIAEVDTRSITRQIRSQGVMLGIITNGDPDVALRQLQDSPPYGHRDYVATVTTPDGYNWDGDNEDLIEAKHRILVTDCGLKYNILRQLRRRGCRVTVVPASTPAEELLAMEPSGVLFSPGPGDPKLLEYVVDNTRKVLGQVPVMGICLGHQIIARALGADTFKLKFGHRGGNHPVKDLDDGRVYITAQNHGYAVSPDNLPSGLEVSHINLNDQTVEGFRHKSLPLFTIQYHSEASPGPRDNEYLFDQFIDMVEDFHG
ncbi:MAG: glutamine-hydrolyzing carbamoyl-phosphate synthase small subunit [Chloroflexota bacterium]|nr:carbamoyl phosphate synthase small subunit [Chloroflexota bacterium]MEC9271559.1 glutamine-hydrolyzing carbamoyl-phosphate synthase small subunit [Chloroflexota bacterium]MEC9445606.1 glutamine-hydrolyzing carbamoyl-phosphate synthase small subunit [Chloroflexota bacterium]